jgi:ion channel-forming bestrophin family protein
MVLYNPKEWWRLIFAFHKSDTFRMSLPAIAAVAVYTGIIAYVENDLLHATFKNTTAIHSLVGFVLSLLLVFRTNTAYDRWWDGRKLWGNVMNDSRNLGMKLSAMVKDENDKVAIKNLIVNFAIALKDHLRGEASLENLNTDCIDCVKDEISHLPNFVMTQLYKKVNGLYENKVISGEQLIFVNEQMQSLVNTAGACERIKNTPIPFSYNIFIKKVIFLYIFTMPFGFAREFGYWSVPIVSLLFYIFSSIELLAEEIEEPFGLDSNDLPLDQICKNLDANLTEIFDL